MMSHLDKLTRPAQQPDVSNYFFHFSITSLTGPSPCSSSFKTTLIKGQQPIESTKPLPMQNRTVNFNSAGLEFMVYYFNVKRPANVELILLVDEVQRGEEREVGRVTWQVGELVGMFLSGSGETLRLERSQGIAEGYELKYTVYVDRNKINVDNARKKGGGVVTPTRQTRTITPPKQPQTKTPIAMQGSTKMRQIEDHQVNKLISQTPNPKPPVIPVIQTTQKINQQSKSSSFSLLDVTGEKLVEQVVKHAIFPETVYEQEHSEKVNKEDIPFRKAVSQKAYGVTNQLGKKEINPKLKAQESAEGNKKMILLILGIIALVYWFFIRGKPQKPSKPIKKTKKRVH